MEGSRGRGKRGDDTREGRENAPVSTSWGKLMTWELTTGGKATWGGENKFSLAGVKCVNKETP